MHDLLENLTYLFLFIFPIRCMCVCMLRVTQ